MNRQIKRIEQTLHRLEKDSASSSHGEASQPSVAVVSSGAADTASVSFQVAHPTAQASSTQRLTAPHLPSSAAQPVQPFIVDQTAEAPRAQFRLPEFSSSNRGFSRHQNVSNPDLALNLLEETLACLQSWRVELQQVIRVIQEVYREGPIVDGWLECSTQKIEATTQILRNAEVNDLMSYVESLCQDPSVAQPEYRLCGLSDDGRMWSTPCSQEQLASISLAISRHHKLQPLLQQKKSLENKLGQAAEITAKFHSQIQSL